MGGAATGTPAAPAPAASSPAATPASREPAGQLAALSGTSAALATSYHALTQLLAAADVPASPEASGGAAEALSSPGVPSHPPYQGGVVGDAAGSPAALATAATCPGARLPGPAQAVANAGQQPRLLCLMSATLGQSCTP